ncbi:uncharacterized protein Z519_00631 [Cladophialophora bantiana CBS 173.52]|uniref:Uncharacterized protein n=1 Tax=Cladophialophora bantiana (strain ATCC 10958 / CBS 173.52 / CDC B-1940 / NIH 8579) TaxID=1442370 RepID=A0A0D2HZU7_CLAB1|nr:uncharacterized protein Z519_00631 [Cladophialophora bantiana CBS 173.52]KIW98968.1 hypothetical protein Z519_00631 [Cladophialophora bantiana CBS 173.52]
MCFGHCSNCGQIDSVEDLMKVLNHPKFEAAFEATFNSYVQSQPDKMHYCPTPDCPTIYKASKEPGVFPGLNAWLRSVSDVEN